MAYSHVQVKDPSLQARLGHSATAFSLTPTLTEVILFGGRNSESHLIADTTVLQFGKSTYHMHHTLQPVLLLITLQQSSAQQ